MPKEKEHLFCPIHNERLINGNCTGCVFAAYDKIKKKESLAKKNAALEKKKKGGLPKCPGHKGEVKYGEDGKCPRCGKWRVPSTT